MHRRVTPPQVARFGGWVVAALLIATIGLAAGPAGAATTLSVRAADPVIDLGRSTALVGAVQPAHATATVVVQRRLHGQWVDRQTGAVAADGTFRIAIRPSQAGIYALRARTTTGSAVSNTTYLRVRLTAAQAIRAVDFTRYHYPNDICGPGTSPADTVLLPIKPSDVAYGDLSGDHVEDAAINIGCGALGGSASWSRLLVFEWQQGRPKFVLAWDADTAPASDWSPYIATASISHEVLAVTGTVVPVGGCHACSTVPWSSRLVLHNGHLQAV